MFEDATFDSRGILRHKSPQWMLSAIAVNLLLLATFVIAPLFYPDSLPRRFFADSLIAPKPPAQLTPVVIRSQPRITQSTVPAWDPFQAPKTIPTNISSAPDTPPAASALQPSDASIGVPGGDGLPSVFAQTKPPAVTHLAPPQHAAITSSVAIGLLLSKTQPIYPAIAKISHISGTVVLAATISPTGAIENLRVLSGHPLLRQAALDAVQNWRYRPYQLNNQPIPVETTINVVFSLTSN